MAILAILSLIVIRTLSSSLHTKNREDARISVQQNVRAAMKVIAEDLRQGAYLRVWNLPEGNGSGECEHDPNKTNYAGRGLACSNHYQIAVVSLTGFQTRIPELSGTPFTDATETWVCDARPFPAGSLAILVNGTQTQLLRITGQQLLRDHTKRCRGPYAAHPNVDKIEHNLDKLTGTWSSEAYLLEAKILTYYIDDDPTQPGHKALFRRSGLNTSSAAPDLQRLVAFDIVKLEVDYGVPLDPNDPSSKLVFYPTLEAAINHILGAGYTPLPTGSGTYVGRALRAVRITLTGKHPGRTPAEYTLTQVVKFRR